MALNEIQVQGSTGIYTIKFSQATHSWSCSCPAWRYQRGVDPANRTCKHIDRLAGSIGVHVDLAVRRRPARAGRHQAV